MKNQYLYIIFSLTMAIVISAAWLYFGNNEPKKPPYGAKTVLLISDTEDFILFPKHNKCNNGHPINEQKTQ